MKLKRIRRWLDLWVTWIDSEITTFSSCLSFGDLPFVACIVFASVRDVLFFGGSQSFWGKGSIWKRHQNSGLAFCGTLYMSDDGEVIVPLLTCIPSHELKRLKNSPDFFRGCICFYWQGMIASFLKKICLFTVSPRDIGHISRYSKTAYPFLHVW